MRWANDVTGYVVLDQRRVTVHRSVARVTSWSQARRRLSAANSQRPGHQLVNRLRDLNRGQDPVDIPTAKHGRIPRIRSPAPTPRRQLATAHAAPAPGVSRQLDTGRGIDDDRGHTSPTTPPQPGSPPR